MPSFYRAEPHAAVPSLELPGVNDIDNDDRVKVLAIVDQFRELGVNEDISLPQWEVVSPGRLDRSFVSHRLGTRFATQIVLRRAPASETSVSISIIPGPAANVDEVTKNALLKFSQTMKLEDFGSEELKRILDEAAQCMGLPSIESAGFVELEKRFSDDILKIELSHPDHRHLSVVDVPGLFHNPTKYQTAEDKVIIRDLIQGYITDKRTIILAVMDARNNLANQEVFHMARAADPDGIRTVGIITKCDALQAGDEGGVLEIFRNEMVRLNHGWFAVKNRSTKEIKDGVTMEQRHINERQFFSKAPWNTLRRNRVGIDPLKGFLGQALFDHIRNEFPGLVNEVQNLLKESKKSLEGLGPPRHTSSTQRQYLIRSAVDYQRDVSNALIGIYPSKLEKGSPRKLRSRLRTLIDEFASRMAKRGHQRAFKLASGRTDPDFIDDKQNYGEDGEDDIEEWIRAVYHESRGVELPGTVNPRLLEGLFREQCTNWEGIATEYLGNVINAVYAYDGGALREFVTDDTVCRRLQARLNEERQYAEEEMFALLQTILADELNGSLQTANPAYSQALDKIREERVQARVASMPVHVGDESEDRKDVEIFRANEYRHNEQQAIHDIHDTLEAYYKVARQRFVDNVIIQAGERYVDGDKGPLKIFSPEFVGGLTNKELSDVAGESFATSTARTDINSRQERLQRALEIARRTGI